MDRPIVSCACTNNISHNAARPPSFTPFVFPLRSAFSHRIQERGDSIGCCFWFCLKDFVKTYSDRQPSHKRWTFNNGNISVAQSVSFCNGSIRHSIQPENCYENGTSFGYRRPILSKRIKQYKMRETRQHNQNYVKKRGKDNEKDCFHHLDTDHYNGRHDK